MPGIFNVGNTYNTNNKRITSNLSFYTGEKFSGKIVKKEKDKNVSKQIVKDERDYGKNRYYKCKNGNYSRSNNLEQLMDILKFYIKNRYIFKMCRKLC